MQDVEPLGISFAKSQSKYDAGHFRKGHDRLYFKIEEEFIEGADVSSRGRSEYWNMRSPIPSGYLTFIIPTEHNGPHKPQRWEESEKVSLERLLPEIVQEFRQHTGEAQERLVREAIEEKNRRIENERRWREHQEKEAIRMKEEQKQKHNAALEAVPRNRQADLIKAAEWWHLHQTTQEFIMTCERSFLQRGDLYGKLHDFFGFSQLASF